MPGKLLRVLVREGQSVTRGQTLVIVEAMKMEHAVKAPQAGRVAELKAREGDMVAPGTPLVRLEGEALKGDALKDEALEDEAG
jgi:biotin carboxyl carrier protein